MGEIPTEGLFLKVFIAWIILAVIFYIWSYLRDGKFIGEEDDKEEEEEDVTAHDVDKVIDQILKELPWDLRTTDAPQRQIEYTFHYGHSGSMNVHQAVPPPAPGGAVSSTAPAPAPAPAPAKAPKVTTKRGLKLNEAGKAKVRHAVKKATTLEDLGEIDKALDSGRISDELATRLELISSDFEAARTPAALPLGAQVLTPGGLMKVRSFIEQATDLDRLAEVDKALNAGDVFRLRVMLNLQPQDIREPGEEPEEVEETEDGTLVFESVPSMERFAMDSPAAFANFLESPGWRELQTRTARRLCDGSYTFDGDCNKPPPPHLKFAAGLIQKLLGRLQSDHPDTAIVPMQAFLCLYEDGQDACPNHVHDCRQLTLSLGAERFVAVEGEKMLMRHGDVMILDGERHGVPADQGRPTQARVSVNIFFTTGADETARPVSVNHRAGSGYQTSGKGRGGKGHSKNRQEGWRQPSAPSAGERRNRWNRPRHG
ncbi:unnamed protein product [Symbiodinium sp. CCMP2592]|nr:unnamed protein product [Symbiodinium sp. CCMP2592]